jgi:hypothetical protein
VFEGGSISARPSTPTGSPFPRWLRLRRSSGITPRFGLHGIEERAKTELTSARELLERHVGQGRFDLSRYELSVRISRASEYVQRAEALERLASGLGALSRLKVSLLERPDGVSVG